MNDCHNSFTEDHTCQNDNNRRDSRANNTHTNSNRYHVLYLDRLCDGTGVYRPEAHVRKDIMNHLCRTRRSTHRPRHHHVRRVASQGVAADAAASGPLEIQRREFQRRGITE